MNYQYLKYFSVLAETEHVTRAAEKLCISQPSLSNAIHALEEEYGVKLYEKRGRTIELTKIGCELAEYLNAGFSQIENGDQMLRQLRDPSAGHIDLGFFNSLGVYYVPDLIKSFKSVPGNEQISFSYGSGNDSHIHEGLKEGKYDLIFCSIVNSESAFEYHRVGQQDMHVIVSRTHPLASRKQISLKELEEEPFISYSQPNGLQSIIAQILAEAGVHVNVVSRAEQGSTIAGMVAAGFGVSILPEIPLPPLDICRLTTDEALPPRPFYLAVNSGRYRPAAVRRFIDYILSQSDSSR